MAMNEDPVVLADADGQRRLIVFMSWAATGPAGADFLQLLDGSQDLGEFHAAQNPLSSVS